MPQVPIVSVGESAAVVLPAAVLEALGLRVGDVVEATVNEGQLILRPTEDAERRRKFEEIMEALFEQRNDAYRRLTYGCIQELEMIQ